MRGLRLLGFQGHYTYCWRWQRSFSSSACSLIRVWVPCEPYRDPPRHRSYPAARQQSPLLHRPAFGTFGGSGMDGMFGGDQGKALVRAEARHEQPCPSPFCCRSASPSPLCVPSLSRLCSPPSNHQEASFKEFLARPENQELVERQQRREVKQAVQLQEKMRALEFRDKVCWVWQSVEGSAPASSQPHAILGWMPCQ